MARIRTLRHPGTGKSWSSRTEGTEVTIISGAAGKQKEVTKSQKDVLATQRFLQKEEGARLREGFVVNNPEATVGEPVMLRFLSRGYTGALALGERGDALLVNRYNDALKGSGSFGGDELWQFERDGSGSLVLSLGRDRLLGKILVAEDRILLGVDGSVRALNPSSLEVTELSARTHEPGALLACANEIAVWYGAAELVVRDLRTNVDRLRRKRSAVFAAALSTDGKILAVPTHGASERVEHGAIELIDTESGQTITTIACSFAVAQLVFFAHDRSLLAVEHLGEHRIMVFDLEADVRMHSIRAIEDLAPQSNSFAADPRSGALAVFYRYDNAVRIYDPKTLRPRLTFELDQSVQTAKLLWTHDGLLATHSDLGYVGLYRVS